MPVLITNSKELQKALHHLHHLQCNVHDWYTYNMIFIPLFVFVLGLIVGSFLNVVILRMNTGRSMVKGRSACLRCNTTLSWYELIPVFSFLFQKGKCRSCRTKISFQYPIVEIITAIVFVLLYNRFIILPFISLLVENAVFMRMAQVPTMTTFALVAGIPFIFSCVIACLLIVITIYDLRHKIIPDTAVIPFIALSLCAVVWQSVVIPEYSFVQGIVSGIMIAVPFFGLWFFSKGRAMGFGDVKLALGIGWLLGIAQGVTAVMFAFWIGAIVGLFLLAMRRNYSMQSEIAFGPFLVIGTFIAGVWQLSIVQLLLGTWS